MQFKALITGIDKREGVKDGKPWKMHTVTAVDTSEGMRCATPIEFTLSKEDEDLAEKLDGQTVTLGLRKLQVYKGRIDAQIRIVRQTGNPPPAAAK